MIPLAIPNLSGNEEKYLVDCIRSNFVSSVGPYVDKFELLLGEKTGAKSAVSTSSGTTALHLGLVTLGVGPNDLVILPSFTFIASANAIRHAGADPWLMDIEAKSWCLDPHEVRHALSKNCRKTEKGLIHVPSGKRVACLMPVYTLGVIADMDSFRAISEEYCLPLLADSAAAIGATYKGQKLGGLAPLSALSFNGNKTLTTGGGGALVGCDETLLKKAKHLCTTARVSEDYLHDEVGFNYRMTNVQAAIGVAQLERCEYLVAQKRKIARRYNQELGALPGIELFPQNDEGESACWFSGIVIPKDRQIEEVCQKLKEKKVAARSFWRPIHLQPPYAQCPREKVEKSNSIWKRILTLPCSTSLSESEQGQVIEAVKSVLS